jgi:hypothetical protein
MAQRGYCKNCRFFDTDGHDTSIYGTCRRRAPIPTNLSTIDGDDVEAWWPFVLPTEWCGEFEIDGSTVPNQTRSF